MGVEFLSDDFIYNGNDLGATYCKDFTTFKVWSPIADQVKLIVYRNYEDGSGKVYDMLKTDQGIWEARIFGDFKNLYYNYRVTINGEEKETPDPYAKGATANGLKGMVVDFASLNPKGWDNHTRPKPIKATEAILYEIHVRDFSVDPHSGIKNKGKYLAFTETGTKNIHGISSGLDHLKELGITHLHLMPIFDFDSIDETKENQYNWGYDPYLYNVPEGSYSTNPYDGTVRIREFKQMIQALHENDIHVVMDVVYNHTSSTKNSPFEILVPSYYYRRDEHGNYTNGSGCGNEIASERAMVRKFIIDSLKFWAREYMIDGFRFDLMALHDVETMKEIEEELRKINPNILLYGEPWTGGASALSSALRFYKGCQRGMMFAVFNDEFRNAIKGDNDGCGQGFVNGAHGIENAIKKGIAGSIHFDDSIWGFAEQPTETINYVSSHDNLTLYDKFIRSNPDMKAEEWEMLNKLAISLVLTSQGITFIQGGSEFLRTKGGNHNSYNAGDEVNKIEWVRKSEYKEAVEYIRGLIKIRKSQKVLTLDHAQDIKRCLIFIESPQNTVAYLLNSIFHGDYKHLVIVHNANRYAATIKLPMPGEWKVIANENEANRSGVSKGRAAFDGVVEVAALSTYILAKD